MVFLRKIFRGKSALSERSVFEKNGGISAEFDGGETVLFNTKDRRSYLLNRSASEIYRLTNGKKSVGNITDMVKSNYGIDKEIIEKDIKEIYKVFLERGIVSHVE
jgi:hypothetical protein